MNYFKNIDMFSSLSIEDQENLSTFCQFRELFKQGDEATAMYLILDGKFSVIKDLEEVNILEGGDIVGEMAFLDSTKKRNASIKCLDAGVVVTMIQYAMGEILGKYPDLYAKIQGIIKERSK